MKNKPTPRKVKNAIKVLDEHFKNRQCPNKHGAFEDSLQNEIYFGIRMGMRKLEREYGFSNTKKNVGGFPVAFIEYLADCAMTSIKEEWVESDSNDKKVSAMDGYFGVRRTFL